MSLDPVLRFLECDFPTFSLSLHKRIELCSWVGQIAVPACAGLYALKNNDIKGFSSLCTALFVNQVCVELIKKLIPCARPNDNQGSFPSGHTAAAVLGIIFLVSRYSFKALPIPLALSLGAVAIIVGISRVVLRAHWVQDVIAGALLGTVVAYIFVEKK